jgi:hypothetical protein
MTPIGPILPYLCLLSLLCCSAAAQVTPPKPAGFLPEAQQWIREHAGDWDHGDFLAARLRAPKSVVLVVPTQPGASSMVVTRCFEALLARSEPLCIGLPAGWEDARALDAWLADGKGEPGALLDKSVRDLARAWNADEKHAHKLRAAGSDYRATREEAIGLTEFVARVDPQLDQRTGQLLGPFRQTGADGRNRYDKMDENWRFAVRRLLEDLDSQVAERREEWEKAAGAAGLAAGLRNLQRIRQAEEEVSKPAEFRRGRALCQNAAAARDELARGAGLVALVPIDAQLEAQEAHAALGAGALVVLILSQGETRDDPDFAALTSVRAGGALDLRELPKEGPLANWFAAHVAKRADVVLWSGVR